MEIKIPELSLVLLIGTSGSGKSTFAAKYFEKYEVISSDVCRGIVSNDENNPYATTEAFELLNYIVSTRLKAGLLTVIDATNVQPESRKKLVDIAREYHVLPVAIVLNLPEDVCVARNLQRIDRQLGKHVVRNQKLQLKRSLRNLKREGFRQIYILKSEEEISSIDQISREKLYSNKKDISGPFDIIGDIHGCYKETILLLEKLGYIIQVNTENIFGISVNHPENRKVIFLGDLVDRGPDSPSVLKLVMSMVNSEVAYCVPGNHDIKLQKKLSGKNVTINHGLAETLSQLESESEAFINQVKEFLYSLTSHFIFDNGNLVVAHAGIREEMQGRGSGAVRSFCLYGETTGETDEFGLPVRFNWSKEYRGKAKVVYGHTPVEHPQWLNKTIDIDTGCVFGGKLTALQYPEESLISVKALQTYCTPAKPLQETATSRNPQHDYDDLLNIEDVTGKRFVQTKLRNNITIKDENSIAALEVMSRFAINPKWLIYLPPTMSPCETSDIPHSLEHPKEAINYYKSRAVKTIICEEKHMGSRAVIIICKNENTAEKRFGISGEGLGACYTRTGRDFFNDKALKEMFLQRICNALSTSGFWERFNTDWVCMDTEILPWSAKAQSLLKEQYAAVGTAGLNALSAAEKILQQTVTRGIIGADFILEKYTVKKDAMSDFISAYQNYCWEVTTIEDLKLAPFHILATENALHTDKTHEWHLQQIEAIAIADPEIFKKTAYKIVQTDNEASIIEAIAWWQNLTESGGEGMVVKPNNFIEFYKGKLIQPAIKCRGKEYLRIIYGSEYDLPENLSQLKNRGLSGKRSLALREFALSLESLERFITKQPLRKIHESVFGVLALESEMVDPRL